MASGFLVAFRTGSAVPLAGGMKNCSGCRTKRLNSKGSKGKT
jgi:hypothetical protein